MDSILRPGPGSPRPNRGSSENEGPKSLPRRLATVLAESCIPSPEIWHSTSRDVIIKLPALVGGPRALICRNDLRFLRSFLSLDIALPWAASAGCKKRRQDA